MRNLLTVFAALMLAAFSGVSWAGDAAAMAETCIDCHDVEEFADMTADEVAAATKEANANSKKMAEATADISADDLKAIIDYLVAEANK